MPAFPDDKPLFVFDGVCVLCSGGVAWLMRHDKRQLFRFAAAQSALGRALYAHYGVAIDDSYLLLDRGIGYEKSGGFLHMLGILGGWWRLLRIFHLMPRPLSDWAYDILARNRYRWFGKAGYCTLIPPEMKERMLVDS